MPIQITIQYKNGETENKRLEKEKITIGRNRLNDVVLPTDEVSREHARIIFREGLAYFSCQGKFGASLNDRRLAAGEEPQLQVGDRIEICDNTLTVQECRAPVLSFFEPTQQAVEAPAFGLTMSASDPGIMRPAPGLTMSASDPGIMRLAQGAEEVLPPKAQFTGKAPLRNRYSTDLTNNALILAKELDTLYRNHVTEDALVRRQKLKEALKNRLIELDETGRHEMIELLKERFCTQDEVWKRLIRLEKEQTAEKDKEEATRATLETVARNLMENARPFQSEAELSIFGDNLQETMRLLLEVFRDLEANRQKNFETEAAQNTNKVFPLQLTTPLKKIGGLLLDWSDKDESNQARRGLENDLRKLRSHEQALKAGYEAGLRLVRSRWFERLNPAALESQVRSEKLKLKISQKLLGPLLDWRCWRRYKQEFQELQNQERTTFQQWFSEEFDRVYQSRMREALAESAGGEKRGKKHA